MLVGGRPRPRLTAVSLAVRCEELGGGGARVNKVTPAAHTKYVTEASEMEPLFRWEVSGAWLCCWKRTSRCVFRRSQAELCTWQVSQFVWWKRKEIVCRVEYVLRSWKVWYWIPWWQWETYCYMHSSRSIHAHGFSVVSKIPSRWKAFQLYRPSWWYLYDVWKGHWFWLEEEKHPDAETRRRL